MKKMLKMTLFKKIFLIIFCCFLCVEGIHMYVDYQNDMKEKLNFVLNTPIENLNSFTNKMMELSLDNDMSHYGKLLFEGYASDTVSNDFESMAANRWDYTSYVDFRGGVAPYIMALTENDLMLGDSQKNIDLRELNPKLLEEIDHYLYKNKDKDIIVEVSLVEDEAQTIILGEEYKLDDQNNYVLAPVKRECFTTSYLKINDWIVFGEPKDVEEYRLYYYSSKELHYGLRFDGYIEEGEPYIFKAECCYYNDEIDKVKNIISSKKNLIELEESSHIKRYAYIDKNDVYYLFDIKIRDPHYSSFGPEYYQAYSYVKLPAFACTVTFIESVSTKLDVYLIALIVSIIASLFISYMLTKRIKRIEEQTKKIAQNNFDIQLDEKHKDELGDLSVSINTMSSNLKNTIKQLNIEIQQVKNLESIRQDFINQFTHEMKTPLGIINGYSELIELTDDINEKQRYLSLINQETSRINELVQSMLKLSRLESGKIDINKEEIDLEYLTVNIVDEFEVLLNKKNIKIMINCINSHVIGDKEQIKTVIRNFISNAIKHTDTKIIITINRGIQVYNEGQPIDEDKLDNIWYTFVTHDHTGSGLGLAICRSILELHGYQYGVTNKQDGVEFYFMDKQEGLEN